MTKTFRHFLWILSTGRSKTVKGSMIHPGKLKIDSNQIVEFIISKNGIAKTLRNSLILIFSEPVKFRGRSQYQSAWHLDNYSNLQTKDFVNEVTTVGHTTAKEKT